MTALGQERSFRAAPSNGRFTPEGGHSLLGSSMSASDPKRTFPNERLLGHMRALRVQVMALRRSLRRPPA
jgi:hypothetical protein